MANIYMVGIGHDLDVLDMDYVTPEPKGEPIGPIERFYGASGVHHDQGLYLKLHWDFINTPTEYQTLLGLFDLNSNETAEVTVYARNDRFYVRKYNGLAHRPEPNTDVKHNNFFIRDVDIYITDLVEIA